MWWAVDILASEYGWAKDDILESVFLDELYELLKQINKRKLNEYRMQLAISQSPHTKDPKALWKVFDEQTRELPGAEFDEVAFDRLKSQLQQSRRIKVK